MANVVEVLLRAKSDVAAVNTFKGSLLSVKSALIGLGAALTFKYVVDQITEAQAAATKLDTAFKNTGATLGRTRKDLDGLASSMQATTVFSDDLVKEAEALLLTFDKVRGDAFERTIKVGADLATMMGMDLPEAVKSLGFALNSPVEGLTRLRRSGIQFSDSQKDLIEKLAKSGQVAQAQSVILSELERKFGGTAKAARDTLGGALAGLKNAFGDLFEGSDEGLKSSVGAINDLSKALADPKIKEGVDLLIQATAQLAKWSLEFVTLITRGASATGAAIGSAIAGSTDAAERQREALFKLVKERRELEAENQRRKEGIDRMGPSIGRNAEQSDYDKTLAKIKELDTYIKVAGNALLKLDNDSVNAFGSMAAAANDVPPAITAVIADLEEVRVTLKRLGELNPLEQLYKDWDEDTKTATQKIKDEYDGVIAKINELEHARSITPADAKTRRELAGQNRGDRLDSLLPEIDINAIRDQHRRVEEVTSETTAIMRGAWEQVGASIQRTFSDMFYSGETSLRSLGDALRRVLADMLSAILMSGIKEALAATFTSKDGSSGSFWGSLVSAVGGYFTGNTAAPAGAVAASSGGTKSSITYAPVHSFTVQGGTTSEKTEQVMKTYIDETNRKNQAEFERKLSRNGIEVR